MHRPAQTSIKVLGKDFVWHSDIVKFDREFVAKVTGAKRLSKKGNYWFPIKFLEDGNDYVLMCENEDIEVSIGEAPVGVWLLFTATGNRETASLDMVPIDDSVATQATIEKVQEYKPPPDYAYENLFDAYSSALATAYDLREWFAENFNRPLEELDHQVATTLLIQQANQGWQIPLSELQTASADKTSSLDATNSQIKEINDLLSTKDLPKKDYDAALAMLAEGISREKAGKWLEKLAGLENLDENEVPETDTKVEDDLPF